MSLSHLLGMLDSDPGFQAFVARLRASHDEAVRLSVADAARPYVLAALHSTSDQPMLIVCARPQDARVLREELACWHARPDDVLLFPEQDGLPYEQLAPDQQTIAERLAVLTRLLDAGRGVARNGDASAATGPLVVASARAVADLVQSPSSFEHQSFVLRATDRIRPDDLVARLIEIGYEPGPVADSPGQFSRRGGILDVYPLHGEPCRIEFFGDQIESLRVFDPVTQRSSARVEWLQATPSASSGTGGLAKHQERATLLEYLPPEATIVVEQPELVAAVASEVERQAETVRAQLVERGDLAAEQPAPFLTWEAVLSRIESRSGPRVLADHDPDREDIAFVHGPAFGGRIQHFIQACREHIARGHRVVVITQQSERIAELLSQGDVDVTGDQDLAGLLPVGHPSGNLTVVHGQLLEGWQSECLRLTLLTDRELFGWHKARRPTRPRRAVGRQTFLSELAPGDLVVHVDHGIATYRGMVTMASESQGLRAETSSANNQREYLLLEYAEGDRLYVPADQADRIARYIGAGDASPTITRLGSGDWNRAKTRARRAVREIAHELLQLYAARDHAIGHAFAADSPWQHELEASFPYVETPDQLRALAEVKEDMERPKPMDRLLVGDVGYGKTEIALRSAFKAVQDGKQVAVLVPTTVLAQQHAATFAERLAAFPVRVEMLSRFRDEREQREVVRGLAAGTVDICIGTHRLLQKDVAFKELGLVIIDEEQRFGVAHKERLKQLRHEVDVLTLTATPIPRTLHMSLAGVRDMSTIETPPEERQPIRTYVTEYDEGLVREAILRELDRGGQVYYVHNRVRSIDLEARRLQKLVPEARIAVGHGQMPEESLERVMLAFSNGEYDVLVCTTIIESGLDIPGANTLIVNSAHRFGLSQLYQLRGRVGRSAVRAYAYFLYHRDTALTETAEKRLRTIFEATELGAGFRIALKDLEIRGAGNLLGAEQHGQISAVGFDLYTRLLAEAVSQLKEAHAQLAGDHPAYARARERAARTAVSASSVASTSITLPLSAYLPADYVEDEPTRLNLYQRLAAVSDGQALGELHDELVDRFGPLPEEAQNLVYVASLRLMAQRAGVQQIQSVDGEIVVKFERLPGLNPQQLSRFVGASIRTGSNQLRLPRDRGSRWMVQLQTLVEHLPDQQPARSAVLTSSTA